MSERADRHPLLRLLPVLILLAVMWLVEVADFVLPADLDQYGIDVRDLGGLPGVVWAPMLHGGFQHLIANTLPFLILGSLVALRWPDRFWLVTALVVVVGGLAVWLLGPSATTVVGASGLIFGYLAFLIAAGVLTRNWLDVVIAVGVLVLYGGVIVSALPFGVPDGVSWQAHLFGAVAGVLAAFLLAPRPDRDPQPQIGA